MQFTDPLIAKIVPFLEGIGISVRMEPVPGDSLLPGVTVRGDTLMFDPDSLPWPGDLLHEAGHIAVSDPAIRATQTEVSSDPGEEMAAMAWSYAAAIELGIDPEHVFHAAGYQGAGESYLESYTAGGTGIGVPMLQFYGMSGEPRHAETLNLPVFPIMMRWLR